MIIHAGTNQFSHYISKQVYQDIVYIGELSLTANPDSDVAISLLQSRPLIRHACNGPHNMTGSLEFPDTLP